MKYSLTSPQITAKCTKPKLTLSQKGSPVVGPLTVSLVPWNSQLLSKLCNFLIFTIPIICFAHPSQGSPQGLVFYIEERGPLVIFGYFHEHLASSWCTERSECVLQAGFIWSLTAWIDIMQTDHYPPCKSMVCKGMKLYTAHLSLCSLVQQPTIKQLTWLVLFPQIFYARFWFQKLRCVS